ncbi:MAG: DUF4125 family protein [Huintestinicola sp.]
MDINEIFARTDELLHECKLDEAESYLNSSLEEAESGGYNDAAAAILNELAGFYRDCGKFDRSLECCQKSEELFERMGAKDTPQYAAAMLNSANAYRAAGLNDLAYDCYNRIYTHLQKYGCDNSLYASYYNNLALLHQENCRWEDACECLEKALELLKKQPDSETRTAISLTNLSVCRLRLGMKAEAKESAEKALGFFRGLSPSDFHYSAALASMGDILFSEGSFEKAAEYYEAALSEIELHMGRNNFYDIVSENLGAAYEKMGGRPKIGGLELCRRYFETFGRPMLKKCFGDILGKIACGLSGEGSECLGFDDEFSADHDYGPSFCIWTDDETYDKYGDALRKAYDLLPKSFMGMSRLETPHGTGRTGVIRITAHLEKFTGYRHVPDSEGEWLTTDDALLSCAVSGEIFMDYSGEFTDIRRQLRVSQPESVRLKKLAQQLGLMAQSGQYNYPRCLKRKDTVTAGLYLSEFMQSTMRAAHILCGRYAPYTKWLFRSTQELPQLSSVTKKISLLTEGKCDIAAKIEEICAVILAELKKQLLSDSDETYLGVQAEIVSRYADRISLSEKIIALEWKCFDKVQNEGGRADCQDDWDTFSKMRRSQYYTWPLELLSSLYEDFTSAVSDGRNPISEKYGFMMQSTAPDRFEEVKAMLPEISEQKAALRDAIVEIQVGMMEDFAKKYPRLAGQARVIRTSSDTIYQTSYETYLRGELSTYSDITLEMYGRFIVSLYKEGKNLAEEIMNISVHLYRYSSLDEAEQAN